MNIKLLFILFISIILLNSYTYKNIGKINIEVQNIESMEGQLRVAVYANERNFLKKGGHLLVKYFPIQGSTTQFILPELPFNQYAVAVYHDVNNNNKFDTNVFGIPTEPYGFVRRPPSKWRAPYFSEVNFKLEKSEQSIQVKLERWKL